MTGRTCIRGCMRRGEHFAACPDFGKGLAGECKGCVPEDARDGAYVCDRDYRRIRWNLRSLPDCVAVIRSKADPLTAAVYDRELVMGSKSDEAPAPVAADLIDSSDAVVTVLAQWVQWLRGGGTREMHGVGFEPGVASDDAHDITSTLADLVLEGLEQIVNDRDQVEPFASWVLDRGMPDDQEAWTVGRVLARWPVVEPAWWAAQPCPYCELRTVKVTPPRHHLLPTAYRCSNCDFEADSDERNGLWALSFSRAMGVAA